MIDSYQIVPARPYLPAQLQASVPLAIQLAGDRAFQRYFDFFTATIRNANTRRAYWRAVRQFFDWCETHVSRASAKRTTGVSTVRINVRSSGRHKCHSMMPRWYQMMS